jgi:hypothetical protein
MKPHIRKLETGCWGMFRDRNTSIPYYVFVSFQRMKGWAIGF